MNKLLSVASGALYAGGYVSSIVSAVDIGIGAVRWKFTDGGGKHLFFPTVVNGVVYVGSLGYGLYAIDAATGQLKWNYSAGGYVGAAAVAGGMVYAGSGPPPRRFYALDANTGALRWEYQAEGYAFSSTAVANGLVYVVEGYPGLKVNALEAGTGDLRWSYRLPALPQGITADPLGPTVANGVVYVGYEKNLYALDATTGALRWSYQAGGSVLGSAVADGVLWMAAYQNVYALEAATGEPRWTYRVPTHSNSGALALANGVLYVVGSPGIYALDAATGQSLWSYNGIGGPLVVANGVLYVGTGSGVTAFESQPIPVNVNVSDFQAAASFPISWTVPITWTGPSAAYYDLLYRDGPSGAWTDLLFNTPMTSTTFTGSQDGHTYYFQARAREATGAIGEWSKPVSTTVDLTPPSGSLDVQGWSSPSTWNTLSLSVSASDATSSVAQMQFGPDGVSFNPWEPYRTATLYVAPPGATAVYGRFKDNAGNVSQAVSATLPLANVPSKGSVSINGGATYANAPAATLSLLFTNPLGGVSDMALANADLAWSDWQAYVISKSWGLAAGPDGERTVYARFRDNAQNVSPVYSDTIILDSTAPGTPQPDDGISGLGNNPRPAFRWTEVTDNLSGLDGYYYKVDSGSESLVVGTAVTLTAQSDGDHTFYVRARDRAGNYSPYGSHAFSIKTTLPPAPRIIQPDTPTASDRTAVSGFSEEGLGVKLYVNQSLVGQTTAGSFGVWDFINVPLTIGENVLYATATDQAGNTSLLSTPVVVDRVEVWAPPPAAQSSSVISNTGGTVAASNNVTVTVPAGAFAEEVNLTLTPYASASAPGVFGVVSANAYTSITAVATYSGAKITSFHKPITITIAYDAALLSGVSESSLQVCRYDEATSSWVALPSLVDTVNHTVSASTTQFSLFDAQVSLLTNKVYLPRVVKGAGGW